MWPGGEGDAGLIEILSERVGRERGEGDEREGAMAEVVPDVKALSMDGTDVLVSLTLASENWAAQSVDWIVPSLALPHGAPMTIERSRS